MSLVLISQVNCSATVNGIGVSENYTPPGFPIVNQASPGLGPSVVALSGGNNSIPVPTGAQTVFLSPPAASTNAKTLKGVNGDTGFPINAGLPSVFTIPSGTTAIIVGSAGSESLIVGWA